MDNPIREKMVSWSILSTLLKKVLLIKHSGKEYANNQASSKEIFLHLLQSLFYPFAYQCPASMDRRQFHVGKQQPSWVRTGQNPEMLRRRLPHSRLHCIRYNFFKKGTKQPYIDSVLDHIRKKNQLNENDILPMNMSK